jgi:hypothetical protein
MSAILDDRVPAGLVWAEGERRRLKQLSREIAAADLPSNIKAVRQERVAERTDALDRHVKEVYRLWSDACLISQTTDVAEKRGAVFQRHLPFGGLAIRFAGSDSGTVACHGCRGFGGEKRWAWQRVGGFGPATRPRREGEMAGDGSDDPIGGSAVSWINLSQIWVIVAAKFSVT